MIVHPLLPRYQDSWPSQTPSSQLAHLGGLRPLASLALVGCLPAGLFLDVSRRSSQCLPVSISLPLSPSFSLCLSFPLILRVSKSLSTDLPLSQQKRAHAHRTSGSCGARRGDSGGGGGGLGKLRGRGGIWALEIQHLGRDVEISRTARKVERDVRVWNRGLLGYGGTREDVS